MRAPTGKLVWISISMIVAAMLAWLIVGIHFSRMAENEEMIATYREDTHSNVLKLRVLTANVGNMNLACRGEYHFNLCIKSVEERIGKSIAKLSPDIIALQEVTDPRQCKGFVERDKAKVCYKYREQDPFYQVRRLVGPDYSIACDARNGFECIAVRVGVGVIEGCPQGQLCPSLARVDQPDSACDGGFTVSAVTVVLHANGMRIGIVNAHPQSNDVASLKKEKAQCQTACRERALRQIFETVDGQPPLAQEDRNLILGDINIDPFRDDDASIQLWKQYVGAYSEGKPYYYHSGPAEHNPPYYTSFLPWKKRTLDHMVSNFAKGTCITLGEAPGTERLDGGKGTDHRALFCELEIPLDG